MTTSSGSQSIGPPGITGSCQQCYSTPGPSCRRSSRNSTIRALLRRSQAGLVVAMRHFHHWSKEEDARPLDPFAVPIPEPPCDPVRRAKSNALRGAFQGEILCSPVSDQLRGALGRRRKYQSCDMARWKAATLLADLHATSCGLKALAITTAAEGLETCHRACGGHGYSSSLPAHDPVGRRQLHAHSTGLRGTC